MKKIYVCLPEIVDVPTIKAGDILYVNLSALQENDESLQSPET